MKMLRDCRGATIWEYAVAMLIGLIAVAAVTALAYRIREEFTSAKNNLRWEDPAPGR